MTFESILIPLIVIVPLFTALAMLLPVGIFNDRRTLWTWTLGSMLATLLVAVLAAGAFDWSATTWQMRGSVPWIPAFGLTFSYGLDGISLWLVLLSTFLMPLVVLAADPPRLTGDSPSDGARQFYFWLLMVEAAMVAAFVATDAIFFFLCFEFTLVPLYFLIGVYGGRQRLPAARLFFVYTFVGSMFTFAGLLYVGWVAAQVHGEWSFDIRLLYETAAHMSLTEQTWVLAALFAGFAVKAPIFPLHTWLPTTYVESPVAGTVVLAAVLAKLGTYGLLRFALPICPDAVAVFAPGIAILAIIGILYAGLICWVQKDLKRLIAYSSISHLGFCALGLFTLDADNLGGVGAVMYMINHGLATGALFLCAGMLYERLRTYEMHSMSGLARTMPVWASFMVFFVMASVALPGLNGFVSEFLTLAGTFGSTQVLGPVYGAAAGLGMIIAAIYLLYMVGRVVFGPVKGAAESAADLTGREIATLAPLAVVCLVLGFYPLPVLQSLEAPVDALTAPARSAAVERSAAPVFVSAVEKLERP